ncbi:hypothetical protein [Sphingomonas sp. M1-B02]|uniref:hypothetical protein n=1 Tax=Sphingomonas sp. M1-B02 TaxID=3114300 RepID=UPI00223E9A20|nr:hypothetical protein [Sphingomonas sp. S6-11]UZK65926.1 hypothetical protein OKW87_15675 [Sphingomonas sp. S6-11]
MWRRLALAACALLLPAAAATQDVKPAIDQVSADLAYGYCPRFLAGQFALADNPRLVAFGFAPIVEKAPNPRFGELQMVTANRADGEISFGGAPQKVCSVVVTGANRDKALARLRSGMAQMGVPFKADLTNTGDRGAVKLESYKGRVDGQMLNVQLIQAGVPEPTVVAQLFVTAE